jgi:pimeloyl-ACP methyl ester carboxylesterase
MQIKNKSFFKDERADHDWFNQWVSKLEKANHKKYERIEIKTSLGKTHVWGLNTGHIDADILVIFPGARTSALFWDLDNNLENLGETFRIFMVETNGLPNLSDGNSPDIKSRDYGVWASEVFDQLNISSAYVAGASFGGLIAMKLGIVAPEKVKAAFLFNPGCLQSFSLSLKNLYYNILPIIAPTAANVSKFLDNAVLCKPEHTLSAEAEKLLIDYEVFALTRYKDNTQKPYDMGKELKEVTVETFLLEGDNDLLFPYETSIKNAHERIQTLRDVQVFQNVGHGIETYHKALRAMGRQIQKKLYAV